MIYTETTKKAICVCFEAHKEQKDKAGLPYVFHPFHLAEKMSDENTTAAALLHDVAEDSAITLSDLEAMGFPPAVMQALALLTHREGEPYMEYVARLACNSIAKEVKRADLAHNSDTSRLDHVTEQDRQRLAKYRMAIRILENSRFDPDTGVSVCRLQLNARQGITMTMTATEEKMMGYLLEDGQLQLALTPQEAQQLHHQLDGSLTFPERMADYLLEHTLQQLIEQTK